MVKYYDRQRQGLVFIEKEANCHYWDRHWEKQDKKQLYSNIIHPWDVVVRFTKKYLPAGSKVLEGGCGLGQNVWKLNRSGYSTVGVDYAEDTIKLIKNHYPDMNIVWGDVTKLPFAQDEFDGYWSIGVIEHFYNGYEPIAKEMARVIKKGGHLFLTFPHMSLLRKAKSWMKAYPYWNENEADLKNFYQFALDKKRVIRDLEKNGFSLIRKHHFDGTKGLKDEVALLKPALQKVYDSKHIVGKVLNLALSVMVAPFSSHSVLLVFKKI